MDDHTSPSTSDAAGRADSTHHGFETPEGLRALLIRLHDTGPGAWRSDREAAELMRYTAERYRPLARRHGLDPWEVTSAAFEVMLTAAVRNADNPWAVVTRAVQITCIAEVRAAGLLVSTSKVRHTGRVAGFHDAVRLADRERLPEYVRRSPLTLATMISPRTMRTSRGYQLPSPRRCGCSRQRAGTRCSWLCAWSMSLIGLPICPLGPMRSRCCAATARPRNCWACLRVHGRPCCGSCWGIPTRTTLTARLVTACCCGS